MESFYVFHREPAQSKCTWTFHKSHFVQKFTRKMPDANLAANVLCEPAQSKCTWTFHKSHFVQKCIRKMPDANLAANVLCEPAQSKCTWTFHKSHFVQKFTRKMPDANLAASVLRLRSRNAHGHFTGAISRGNLQGKCRTRQIPPRSNTGP